MMMQYKNDSFPKNSKIFVKGSYIMTQFKIRRLTTLAMLAAVSIVLVMAIRIPMFLPFLEYDPADIPILVGTFLYGPMAGLALTVAVSVVQGLTVSASSGPIGIAMHILATGAFALTAGSIYKRRRNRTGAVCALVSGSLVSVVIMVIWNIVLTPIYMGVPRAAVIELLIPAIIPFNLAKTGINSLVTLLIYKPVSRRLAHMQEVDKRNKI
jgi:riboflavin transporter FmnP